MRPIQVQSLGSSLEMSEEEQRAKTTRLTKSKLNDPTALDVITELINPVDDEKASVHMKGHIDEDTIN